VISDTKLPVLTHRTLTVLGQIRLAGFFLSKGAKVQRFLCALGVFAVKIHPSKKL